MKKRSMFGPVRTRAFREKLLRWFAVHKRDLPWRQTDDPYAIWVSEIMLQQTRVAAVLEHYAHWMQLFPTIRTLATAAEDQVLAAWSGLGYYRRARFLHRGAQVVVSEYEGKIPETAAELHRLPGVGAYTSAAIASIAFGEVAAAVDGNVERVILRQTGRSEAGAIGAADGKALGTAEIQSYASQLIDPRRPGDFNQAMMELGATVCLPKRPLCLSCPVFQSCKTRGEHPTRRRKAGMVADAAYGLVQRSGVDGRVEILLQRRSSIVSLMPGLWELPEIPGSEVSEPAMILRHAILQTNYRVQVIAFSEDDFAGKGFRRTSSEEWMSVCALRQLPLTGLARKILRRSGLLGR